MVIGLAALAVAMASGGAPNQAVQANHLPLAEILAKVTAAQHFSEFKRSGQTLTLVGEAQHLGVDGKYELKLSPDGRFVGALSNPLGVSCGYDGKTAWETDVSGAPQVLSGESSDAVELTYAVVDGTWLDDPSRFDVGLSAVAMPPGITELAIRMRSSADQSWNRLDLDSATWLPTRLTSVFRGETVTTDFQNWDEGPGLRLPMSISTSGGLMANCFSAKLHRTDNASAMKFEAPSWQASDTSFDPSKPAEIEVKETPAGVLLVRPRINHRDVGWFLLDTGTSAMVLDAGAAKELGLSTESKIDLAGIGGSGDGEITSPADFGLGPISIRIHFVTTDLTGIGNGLFVKLGGIVGYDFFRRAVVTLDVRHKKVAIYDPERFKRADLAWQPLLLDDGCPLIDTKFEGNNSGYFEIDTASKQMVLCSPTVDRLELTKHRKTEPGSLPGIGGSSNAVFGQLRWINLGSRRMEDVDAFFSTSLTGIYANGCWAGTLGLSVLNSVRVVFDYPDGRVAFN